jgi:hypothetical protein
LLAVAASSGEVGLTRRPDFSRPSPSEVPGIWADGAERSLGILAASSRQIVVLDDPPYPVFDVPTCLSSHPDSVGRCAFPRSNGHEQTPIWIAMEPKFARLAVRYADLQPWTCPEVECPVVTRQGAVMFRDGYHFAASFSRSMWRLVSAAVDSANATPRR